MRPGRPLLLLLLLPLVLLAAGCGGTSGGGGGTASSSGKTITISETEFKLDPSTVDLKGAGTYVFKAKNDGQYPHALTIEGNGMEAHTDTIDPGSSGTVSVTLKAGTYQLYCPVDGHRARGMTGTLTVGGAGSGAGSSGTTTTNNTGHGGYGY